MIENVSNSQKTCHNILKNKMIDVSFDLSYSSTVFVSCPCLILFKYNLANINPKTKNEEKFSSLLVIKRVLQVFLRHHLLHSCGSTVGQHRVEVLS